MASVGQSLLYPCLVLGGVFLLFHFSQSGLQVVDVSLQLGALVLQLALLGENIRADLLLVLQPLRDLLQFGVQLDLSFDEQLTAFLGICKIVLLLKKQDYLLSVFPRHNPPFQKLNV